jgi:2-polyprenyl-3-methyl-5-hydroxy-6-metoxy-1,4-benzoquinol methylase
MNGREAIMGRLKDIAKELPVLPSVYRLLRSRYDNYRKMIRRRREYQQLKAKSTQQVFTDIYKENTWRGKNSRSGSGSDIDQTQIIANELPILFSEFRVSTLLDIPCGDFHWMKNVDLSGIDYTGADVVDELIRSNTEHYARDGVRFQKINLLRDSLPKAYLIFCRDCLVHFSFEDIFHALANICNSDIELLLTTTFPERKENRDIATGQWRVLNLEVTPFVLPRPLKIINEGCTQGRGAYTDKSLGLWRVADIRESLTTHTARRAGMMVAT